MRQILTILVLLISFNNIAQEKEKFRFFTSIYD